MVISACCGDAIGSRFEGTNNIEHPRFRLFTKRSRFTDDSVLTVATMDAIMNRVDYGLAYKAYYKMFPHAGYGSGFKTWARSKSKAGYNSFGNGSAMRVSPIAYAYNNIEDVLKESRKSAEVSHNHAEGIRGAQALALSVFLARHKFAKSDILLFVEKYSGYKMVDILSSRHFGFDVSCQGSVPLAIGVFLQHNGFENIIRKSIMLGGDSDTIASMAGAIAGAYYGVPTSILESTRKIMHPFLLHKIDKFEKKLGIVRKNEKSLALQQELCIMNEK